MRRLVLIVSLAACGGSPKPTPIAACPPQAAAAEAPAAPKAAPLDEATAISMSHAFLDAFDRADADAFAKPLGAGFVLFEDARFMDASVLDKTLRARSERQAPAHTRTWSDEHVMLGADSAVFIADAVERIPAEGGHPAAEQEGYNTLVWVRQGAAWQVVAWEWVRGGIDAKKDRWNDAFRQSVGFKLDPNTLLVETVKGRKPGAAIDLESGQGRNAVYLATQGWKVTAVDISDVGLKITQENAAKKKVEVTTVDADTTSYDLGKDRWDLVTMIYAGNSYDLVDRIKPSLRKGGLFVTEYFASDSDAAKSGAGGWDPAELAKHFGDGWKILRNDHVDDIADYSLRTQKLVRFVAQKL